MSDLKDNFYAVIATMLMKGLPYMVNSTVNNIKNYVLNPFYLKIGMIIATLLTAVPYIHNLFGQYVKIFLLWGAVILLYKFIKKSLIKKDFLTFMKIGFCVSYTVTVLMNYQHMLGRNISQLCYMVMFMFVFCDFDENETREEKIKEMKTISNVFVTVMFVFSIISLILFMFFINIRYHVDNGYMTFGIYENRLWGLYNPNVGASLQLIAIALSAICIFIDNNTSKGFKRFHISNIIIQFICLVLAQSRTSLIACAIFTGMVVFVYPIKLKKIKINKYIIKTVSALLVVVAVYSSADIVKNVSSLIPQSILNFVWDYKEENAVASFIIERTGLWNPSDEFDPSTSDDPIAIDLERVENLEERNEGMINGRLDLWKAGFKVWQDNPIFGCGRENIYDYGKVYLAERWQQNLRVGGLHNGYITVFVSSGVAGFAFYIIFICVSLWKMLKMIFKNMNNRRFLPIAVLFVLIFSLLLIELMETRIVYTLSIFTVFFWIYYGYACYFLKEKDKE